jgi:hypothetical protein
MKRWIVAALVAAAWPAWADGPEDFSTRARIVTAEEDALQRLPLPPEVYRDARPDLADVRVFNAAGEAVPIALGTEPEQGREAQVSGPLPQFPVTSLDVTPEHTGVSIRMSDGTLVSVTGAHKPATVKRTAAYLIDASTVKLPMRALVIDWEPSPGNEVVRVRLEASSDLRTWRPLAGPVSIVHLEQAGHTLEQPRVPLGRTQEKYLRLTWDGPPLVLRSVRVEFEDRLKPPERMTSRVTGKKGDKPGEIVYDLGARYPVEALRLIPAERNSVIPATFVIDEGRSGTAPVVASGVFYDLRRNGQEVESQPLEIGHRAARHWIARIDPNSGAVGEALPDLEVQWRPATLVFVARGAGPFTLAFGDSFAKPTYSSPATLIPSYESHSEDTLPLAKLGAIERNPLKSKRYPEWMAGVPPRRFALWTILVVAVAGLGFMAWRLGKQVK